MNSSADSVDLLPKALSTINENLLKTADCRFPVPVYSHLVILSHFDMLPSLFSFSLAKCATKMGLNAGRGGDSHLGDGLFEGDVDDAQDGCALWSFSHGAARWPQSPAAAPQLESPHTHTHTHTTHNTPIMKIYCGHAGK